MSRVLLRLCRRHGEGDVQAKPWNDPKLDGMDDFAAKHAGLFSYMANQPNFYEFEDSDDGPAVRLVVLEIE